MRALWLAVLFVPLCSVASHHDDEAAIRKPLLVATPEYPTRAFRQRREGKVEVCFGILADGRVYRAYVASSSHRVFNRSALRAIRASLFEPDATSDRAVRGCRTFEFTLQPVTTANLK